MKLIKGLNVAVDFSGKSSSHVWRATGYDYQRRAGQLLQKNPVKAFWLALDAVEKIPKYKPSDGTPVHQGMVDLNIAKSYIIAFTAYANSQNGINKNIYSEVLLAAKKVGMEDKIYQLQCMHLLNELSRTTSNTEKLRLAREGVAVATNWFAKYRLATKDSPPADLDGAVLAAKSLLDFIEAKNIAKKATISDLKLWKDDKDTFAVLSVSVFGDNFRKPDLSRKADAITKEI